MKIAISALTLSGSNVDYLAFCDNYAASADPAKVFVENLRDLNVIASPVELTDADLNSHMRKGVSGPSWTSSFTGRSGQSLGTFCDGVLRNGEAKTNPSYAIIVYAALIALRSLVVNPDTRVTLVKSDGVGSTDVKYAVLELPEEFLTSDAELAAVGVTPSFVSGLVNSVDALSAAEAEGVVIGLRQGFVTGVDACKAYN